MDFDVVPYEDIVWGKRLGAGSFGSVYKGRYLGIDIAIKEVRPSTEYDVHKYFEREWRIMRECRHPNIVLFLGLSRAPEGDGRVFIISEFVPRGNLRHFILSRNPFPWRLRISFATDVARALAYLHARQCIHRDLKGENLLIASNDRIKVTDFGFARIASRNAEEMKRMTFCGTDGYMSPEIINGFDFDLPTDVFSLGIIFIEILCRRLVDSKTFVREAPHFVPNPDEVRRRASRNCPPAFIDLALECCREEPFARPQMPEVLHRLREIEKQVLTGLPEEDAEHVGSIRLIQHGGKRGMPVFEPLTKDEGGEDSKDADMEESDRQMEEDAIVALAHLKVDGSGASEAVVTEKEVADDHKTWRTARWVEEGASVGGYSEASELDGHYENIADITMRPSSFYVPPATSSAVTQVGYDDGTSGSALPLLLDQAPEVPSMITVKGASEDDLALAAEATSPQGYPPRIFSPSPQPVADPEEVTTPKASAPAQLPKVPSPRLMTKKERAEAEDAQPDPAPLVGTHRFTLVDKDALNLLGGKKASAFPSSFAAFLPKALTASSKCPVCAKRLNTRPSLQCDDCSIIVHVKCSHAAARNCHGGDEQ